MNNPLRAFIQRHYEAPLLARLGGSVEGLKALEIGCGRGVGAEILIQRFKVGELVAFDLDPAMIDRARVRLASYIPGKVSVMVGDACAIDATDASFDAVFDFGIIHHIPDWQKAVGEVRRVLKPGGRFFFEEVTRKALSRSAYRKFLVHPEENRFSPVEFISELEKQEIKVDGNYVERWFGDFFIGVGKRL